MHNPLRLEQVKNQFLRNCLKKFSSIDKLEAIYDKWIEDSNHKINDIETAQKFIDYILEKLDVKAFIRNDELLQAIPKEGPLIIVSNHPMGCLEGMLLSKILLRIRPDLKVLTNKLLKIFPEFDELFIGVDVLNPNRQKENAKGMRCVAKHLASEGALLIFPAGTVSAIKLKSFKIEDKPWTQMVTKLAVKYKCAILPVYIEGKNPYYFYFSAFINKKLRTSLLPRAMVNNLGKEIPINIGSIISLKDIKRFKTPSESTSYIRLCCEVLQKNKSNDTPVNDNLSNEVIKKDVDTSLLIKKLETLDEFIQYQNGEFFVYCVPYDNMGVVMDQLAIERERTFRQVGEGTGKELDSDVFDPNYYHLFLWDKLNNKIVGGYRIGVTNKIVNNLGLDGLYSHSLFKYNNKFIQQVGETIELGRSFVTVEYQCHAGALDMLWKGIGRFVENNPQYHSLFGCVSISKQYSSLASSLLVKTFLRHYGAESSIKSKVKARRPIANIDKIWSNQEVEKLSKIPMINKLVGRIETGKTIPTLIKYYLALNGQFVSFTVNEGFNNSLDGLIIVDLRNAPDRYLRRYMSDDGLKEFKQKWSQNENIA